MTISEIACRRHDYMRMSICERCGTEHYSWVSYGRDGCPAVTRVVEPDSANTITANIEKTVSFVVDETLCGGGDNQSIY